MLLDIKAFIAALQPLSLNSVSKICFYLKKIGTLLVLMISRKFQEHHFLTGLAKTFLAYFKMLKYQSLRSVVKGWIPVIITVF